MVRKVLLLVLHMNLMGRTIRDNGADIDILLMQSKLYITTGKPESSFFWLISRRQKSCTKTIAQGT